MRGVSTDAAKRPDAKSVSSTENIAAENTTFGSAIRTMDACCTAADKTTDLYSFQHNLGSVGASKCVDLLEASISKGRILYRPAVLAACQAAFAAAYGAGACTSLTEPPLPTASAVGACEGLMIGTGAAGGPCTGNQDCGDGLSCVGHTDGAEGTCAVAPPVGAPCGPGPTDGGSFTFTFTFGGKAHPVCAEGAACNSSSRTCAAAGEGTKCSGERDCPASLYCVNGACGTAPPGGTGATCRSNGDCARDHYCGRSGADSTCVPKKTVGGACTGGLTGGQCIGRCDDADGGSGDGTCASHCGSR